MAGKEKRNKKGGGASSSQNPPSPPAILQYPPSFPPPFPVTSLPPPPFPPQLIPATFLPPPPFRPPFPATFLPPPPFRPPFPATFLPPPPFRPPFPATFLPPPPFRPPFLATFLPPPQFPPSPVLRFLPPPPPPIPPLQIRAPAVNTTPTPIKLVTANSDNLDESKYELYFHDWRVRVIMTSSPNIATNWINTTYQLRHKFIKRAKLIIGIGAHSTPNGPTTITFCVGPNCLIFHLHHAQYSPPVLKKFLADTNIAFVRLDNSTDLYDTLASSQYGLVVNRLIDLRPLAVARDYGLAHTGWETMVDKILGLKGMVKDEAVEKESNWENNKLSEDQVKYATIDAFLSYLMGKNLDASNY